jgi:hypothetical protein
VRESEADGQPRCWQFWRHTTAGGRIEAHVGAAAASRGAGDGLDARLPSRVLRAGGGVAVRVSPQVTRVGGHTGQGRFATR